MPKPTKQRLATLLATLSEEAIELTRSLDPRCYKGLAPTIALLDRCLHSCEILLSEMDVFIDTGVLTNLAGEALRANIQESVYFYEDLKKSIETLVVDAIGVYENIRQARGVIYPSTLKKMPPGSKLLPKSSPKNSDSSKTGAPKDSTATADLVWEEYEDEDEYEDEEDEDYWDRQALGEITADLERQQLAKDIQKLSDLGQRIANNGFDVRRYRLGRTA